MKRAVLCVSNPENYIQDLNDYSVMIVNPESPESRKHYLLEKSDYSLLITNTQQITRNGDDYADEKVFWYTSGTTGDSKFCSFSQTQLDRMAQTICNAYEITSNDRYVGIMPLWHAHGQGFYWATKLAGCETRFFNISSIRQIEHLAPTFITAVPDFLKVIAKCQFQTLRFIRSASAALPNDLYMILKEKFNVPVIEAFGMTEAMSHCFTNPLRGPQRMGTVGNPDGIEAEIVDGHLFIKGPNVVTGTWYNTGDLAEQDDQGFFVIKGRHKDQINIRGIKINPISIEQQLKKNITNIGDCVVFGQNSLKCIYTGDCEPEEIVYFLLRLGTYCRPNLVEKLDGIPVSPSGKISRSWLASKF